MQETAYDVVILGAGPAGSNLARRIDSRAMRVLLVDGEPLRGEKVCAGLLSPDAQDLLAAYDISLPRELLVTPQLFSVRTIDLACDTVRHYRRSYMNIDRAAFDRFLRGMVPPTVTKLQARATRVWQTDSGYQVETVADGRTETLTCRYLIGADGASSLVRRSLFPGRRLLQYTAIQQWFPAGESNPYYSCIFDAETSPGCSWIFFKNGQMIFGGAFEKQGCRAAFEKQKQRLIARGFVSASAFCAPQRTEACLVSRPRLLGDILLGRGSAFLVGEAAGLISPSSFEGISYALASSEALAASLSLASSEKEALRLYRRRAAPLCRKVRLRCLKRPFMYHPPLRRLILKTGLCALQMKGEA